MFFKKKRKNMYDFLEPIETIVNVNSNINKLEFELDTKKDNTWEATFFRDLEKFSKLEKEKELDRLKELESLYDRIYLDKTLYGIEMEGLDLKITNDIWEKFEEIEALKSEIKEKPNDKEKNKRLEELRNGKITEENDQFSKDLEVDEGIEYEENISSRIGYGLLLREFLDNYDDLSYVRERLSLVIEYNLMDNEAKDIAENYKEKVKDTINNYKYLIDLYTVDWAHIDEQCKNVDFRLRKSLDLELDVAVKVILAFRDVDEDLLQKSWVNMDKAIELISPVVEDIKEIISELYNL